MEILQLIADAFSGNCVKSAILGYYKYKSKTHTVDMICDHPELSDEKVKYLTSMIKDDSNNQLN